MRILPAICLCLLSAASFAQKGRQLNYRFYHLDQSNGLKGNIVSHLLQDDEGYVWIKPDDNYIQRYDGVRFRDFSDRIPENSNRNFLIQSLIRKNGKPLVFINDSAFHFNPAGHNFIPYFFQNKKRETVSFTDTDFNRWEIHTDRIIQFNQEHNRIQFQYCFPELTGKNTSLAYDSINRQYWLVHQGLWLFDAATSRVSRFGENSDHPLFRYMADSLDHLPSDLLIDHERNLWVAFWGGPLLKYNLDSKELKRYHFQTNTRLPKEKRSPTGIHFFCIDKFEQLWLATYGLGLLKYNRQIDDFDYILSDKNDPDALQYNHIIYSLFQDLQDNIWVGTDKGISIFNPYQTYFESIGHRPGDAGSMPSSELQQVIQLSNGDIWVGSWGGGITVFDRDFNFKTRHTFDSEAGDMVWAMVEDHLGRVWVTGQRGLVHRYDMRKNQFEPSFYIEGNRHTLRNAIRDHENNIYFGTHNGRIIRWNAADDSFTFYGKGKAEPPNELPVLSLNIDNQKNIWASNMYAAYRLEPERMIFSDSILTAGNTMYSRNGVIVENYSNERVLLSCPSGGGGFLDAHTLQFSRWDSGDELRNKKISALKTDKEGNIWFTAGFRIHHFNPAKAKKVTSYSIPKSLIHSAFVPSQLMELQNGNWCALTNTEIIVFDPAKLLQVARLKKPVSITGLKIFDEQTPFEPFFENGKNVVLGYKQNFITVEFASLQYLLAEDVRYSYRLSGVDKNWVSASDLLSASYTNLKPGKYQFAVRVEGETDESSNALLTIEIEPPFWHTWWFYMLCGIVAVSAAYLIHRRRIKRVRAKAQMKQQIMETEMAALRAQMNPHFIFNSLSAIDSLIQNNKKEAATTYLARFAKLIRNVLDSSKNNTIPFYKDFETVKLFIELEQLRSSNKFSYKLKADEELLNGDFKVPPMLIQPFIENAIHHGLRNKETGNKQLTVVARLQGDDIIYTISDNGVGRKKAEELKNINRPEHVSYGIQISRDRIRNFNQHFQNSSSAESDNLSITDLYLNNEPAGTKVRIKLKVS